MKGTFSAFLRSSLTVVAIMTSILVTSVTTVGATSVTARARTSSALSACGVVASPSVHVVSKNSPCIIRVRVGTNVQVKLRSGFRWGYPVSNARSVVVTTISRSSIGVNDFIVHAASVGHAMIRVTGTVYCKSGVACPDLALLWSLKVIVT
jgi:hypothetical protein